MSSAPPPPTAAPPPSPNLDECIKSITSLGGNTAAALTTTNQATLALALVEFSMHLSRDQDTLAAFLIKEVSNRFPVSDIPAMREVVANPFLLQCLLRMLSLNPNIHGGTSGSGTQLAGSSYRQKHGRKRSPSEDASPHTSRKKTNLSPNPIMRSHPNQAQLRVVSAEGSKGQLSAKYIPVFAATILYSVFQHADHWPVQIMKAFAEDSFGSRIWVDDERCKSLVSNLLVSLKPEDILDCKSASVAEEVGSYLSSLVARSSPIETAIIPRKNVSNGQMTFSSQRTSHSQKEERKQAKNAETVAIGDPFSSSVEEELPEPENAGSYLSQPHHSLNILFQPSSIQKKQVRPRYHMHSLDLAYEAISDAFQDRLDSKSKQNYRLLQTLPPFLSIPKVRCLSSRHLERWLQSPALAGLARNIFAHSVQELKCVEPPLPDDLEMIDNVLKLNLKTNQLSMHIEHISLVAKKIPTKNVAQLIFSHCLREYSQSVSNALKPSDDHLRMLRSVYAVLDRKLAAEALASSVLTSFIPNPTSKMSDLNLHFQNISCLLCAVVDALGELFEGFHFVEAIIKAQSGTSKTVTAANATARLIFEFTLLVTRTLSSLQTVKAEKKAPFYDFDTLDEGDLNFFRNNMLGLRKKVLRWCSTDLCRVYYTKVANEEETKCSDTYYEKGAVMKGPGAPDYSSVLGVESLPEDTARSSPFHKMMAIIRYMLFLSPKEPETFTVAADEEMDKDRLQRIEFCCQYGVDVDNEMLQIVLSSPHITPDTALSVIENLLSRCGTKCASRISCHVDTVWDMYKLAEYTPVFRSGAGGLGNGVGKPNLPTLAVTSMWWRVSSIALCLCGLLPTEIGSKMWDSNPTLAALIRMTTSQKYRFPTADCDEREKQRVRQAEEIRKEQELKIAEYLFMPAETLQKQEKSKPRTVSPVHDRRGLRSSARQREKLEKHMAIEWKCEQERQAAENMKLRKILRILQKNVMIFDPKQVQRRPPKGSIDLLLSVNESFGLAEKFRLSTSPDYLLKTIGEGRSAIERAYDWLIPIISSHPAIIDRLQPSASCFLLLRAYGVEGDKNRELLDLTSPLLYHVKKCLTGEFGEHHALLAMELLLQDIADENNDRRRCARKVLHEAFGNASIADSGDVDSQFHCGWLSQMQHIKNSKELVPLVIKYLTRALAYERGSVFNIYLSTLDEFQKIDGLDFDFVSTLCELIAVRSHVCSDAFDRFPPLRALAINQVKNAFEQAIESSGTAKQRTTSLVTISIPREGNLTNVVVSSNLLHAAIILISNWQSRDYGDCEVEESSILHLLGYLVIPFVPDNANKGIVKAVSGLSSAMYNEKRAVSVEEWVRLSTARAEKVAKHAALSAPNIFLPRLLLCCGMPSPSFYTMLHRLDKMGDSSEDAGRLYADMISPTAVSEWGLPGIGSRHIIKQKLYGRIMAYVRVHGKNTAEGEAKELSATTSPFISWLSGNCSKSQAMTENAKHEKLSMSDSSDFDDLMEEEDQADKAGNMLWLKDDSKNSITDVSLSPKEHVSEDFVNSCLDLEKYHLLEESLHLCMEKSPNKENEGIAVAKALLASFRDNSIFVQLLLKWVPVLTSNRGEDHLWQLIFIEDTKQSTRWCHLKSLVCECAVRWSDEHIAACQGWIVSQQANGSRWKSVYSLELVLRFFVVSSEQKSIHCFDYDSNGHFYFPEECAISLTKLAMYCASLQVSYGIANDSQEEGPCAATERRNTLPDWLTIVLLVGKCHLGLVTKLILKEVNETRPALMLSSTLLRLYVLFPLKTDLSDSKLRNVLLQASNDHLPSWLYWRCPLDSQLSEMLSNLTKSPHQRLAQSITDISKQHPLIFVRHLNTLCQKLLQDGSGRDSKTQRLMKRGRIFGRHPSGDAIAQVGGHTVKVTIVLWGYSFNEPVWNSVLDVLMALPLEVVFRSGVKLGLTEILETFLKLLCVQIVELNSEVNIIRVREKLGNLIESFRKYNAKAFDLWMQQGVSDGGHAGNVQQLLSVAGIGD